MTTSIGTGMKAAVVSELVAEAIRAKDLAVICEVTVTTQNVTLEIQQDSLSVALASSFVGVVGKSYDLKPRFKSTLDLNNSFDLVESTINDWIEQIEVAKRHEISILSMLLGRKDSTRPNQEQHGLGA